MGLQLSCVLPAPAEQGKHREEELKCPRHSGGQETRSLLNIAGGGQTMGGVGGVEEEEEESRHCPLPLLLM